MVIPSLLASLNASDVTVTSGNFRVCMFMTYTAFSVEFIPSNGGAADRGNTFGSSIALSGNTIVVGDEEGVYNSLRSGIVSVLFSLGKFVVFKQVIQAILNRLRFLDETILISFLAMLSQLMVTHLLYARGNSGNDYNDQYAQTRIWEVEAFMLNILLTKIFGHSKENFGSVLR